MSVYVSERECAYVCVAVTIAFMVERLVLLVGVCEQRMLLAGHQTYILTF